MAVFHYCAMVRRDTFTEEKVESLLIAAEVTDDGASEWMRNTRWKIAEMFDPPVEPRRVVVLSLTRIGG